MILDAVEKEQTKLCPDQHRMSACPGTSTCKICNQQTGEWNFRSDVSHLLDDQCVHKFNGSQIQSYFTMDVLKNNTTEDIKDPATKIIFDSTIMTHVRSLHGRALCVSGNTPVVNIEKILGPKINSYFISLWLKHECQSDMLILTAPLFTLYCYTVHRGLSIIMVSYQKKNYWIYVSYGLWYHMSISMTGKEIKLYVNGIRQNPGAANRSVEVAPYQYITIFNKYRVTCLDELLLSSSTRSDAQVKAIYELYSPIGKVMSHDQRKHIISPYEFNAVIATNYTPLQDIKEEEKRLQLVTLDSIVWLSEITDLTKGMTNFVHAEFLDQYFYDNNKKTLHAIFHFYLSQITNIFVNRITSITGPTILKIEHRSTDLPIPICNPLGTGKYCFNLLRKLPAKEEDVGYQVDPIKIIEGIEHWQTCSYHCRNLPTCVSWSLSTVKKNCVVKPVVDNRRIAEGGISGSRRLEEVVPDVEHDIDYMGNGIPGHVLANIEVWQICSAHCRTVPSCLAWVFQFSRLRCYLKYRDGNRGFHKGLVSGLRRSGETERKLTCPFSHPYAYDSGKHCYRYMGLLPKDLGTDYITCPDVPCADFDPGVSDTFFKLRMASLWSNTSYTAIWDNTRAIDWHEKDTGYYMMPPITLYINFTSSSTTLIKRPISKRFRAGGLKYYTYYDVCVIPESFGGMYDSFCGTKKVPPTPVIQSCKTISCEVEGTIVCKFTGGNYNSQNILTTKYRVFWSHKNHISSLVRRGEINTWNLESLNNKYIEINELYEVRFPALGKYANNVFGVQAIGDHVGVAAYQIVRSCPAAPRYYPRDFIATTLQRKVTLSWTALSNAADVWYYVPGSYNIYFGDFYLVEDLTFFQYQNNVTNIKGTELTLSVDELSDELSCVHYFQVAATSYALGPMSKKICLVLMETVPRAIANVTFVEIVNVTSANISIHSILPQAACGIDKYVAITAVDVGENSTDKETIQERSAKLIRSNLDMDASDSGKHKVYNSILTYDVEISEHANISGLCSKGNFIRYIKQMPSLTFIIDGLNYYTNYSVMTHICNEHGCGNASDPVTILSGEYIPSCHPPDFKFENGTSTSIVLAWSRVPKKCRNGIIIGFNISLIRSRDESRIDEITPLKTITFEDLEKYEEYCAQIAAITVIGMGPYSSLICKYTNEDAHKSIADVKDIQTFSRTINISVLPPTDPYELNSILREIVVYYQAVDVLPPLNDTTSPDSMIGIALQAINYTGFEEKRFPVNHTEYFHNDTHYLALEDLLPYTFYAIRLAYQTDYSLGNSTEPFIVLTKEDVPSLPPFNVSGSGYAANSIYVTWEDVPVDGRLGILRGYTIYYSYVEKSNNTLGKTYTMEFNDTKVHQAILTELIRDSEYNISVSGLTAVGNGVRSVPIKVPTGEYKDGNWTEWSMWSFCSATCELGSQNRSRNCTNPVPWNGGYNCTDSDVDVKDCNLRPCEVNGTLTEWGEWSFCSVSCGGGISNRKRKCVYHKQSYLPIVCYDGKKIEERKCKEHLCPGPVLAKPGMLNCHEACRERNLHCDISIKTKNTTAVFKEFGLDCSSNTAESKWSEQYHPIYYPGNKVCAGYVGVPEVIYCKPNKTQSSSKLSKARRICNCFDPVDLQFFPWAKWSFCSGSCTGEDVPAIHTRQRVCIREDGDCKGETSMFKPCSVPHCPVDGVWGDWSEISPCNKSCDYGYRFRRRKCDNPKPAYDGMECPGLAVNTIPGCNAFPCPQHGGVSEWSEWSISEKACGITNATRRRFCNTPEPKFRGIFCVEELVEHRPVKLPDCPPVDVSYVIKFTEEKWNYRLYYTNRALATALKRKIRKSWMAMVKNDNSTEINFILFKYFKRGSVIAFFTIQYKYLDRDQIVTTTANMMREEKVDNMTFSDIHINVLSVPCSAPSNISYTVIDPTTVNITWLDEGCNMTDHRYYLYYAAEEDVKSGNADWIIHGIKYATTNSTNSSYPSMTIYGLLIAVTYRGYLLHSAVGIGNGSPSKGFNFITVVKRPEKAPAVVSAISNDPTKFFVEWVDIPSAYWGGELIGYKIRYKKYLETNFTVKTAARGFLSRTLVGLKPYSLYYIEVCGYNSAGDGPPEFDVKMTQQGVPILVPNVKISTKQHINWWNISWGEIPYQFVNGVLLGYRIRYYMTHRSGKLLGGEIEENIIEVNNLTFYQKVTGLENYATYAVTVAGFTVAGDGPADVMMTETCKCARNIFVNWYPKSPYTNMSTTNNVSGLLPPVIMDMMIAVCGHCAGYKSPTFFFNQSLTGLDPRKSSEYELRRDISKDVDISFPVYGQAGKRYIDNSLFLLMIQSSGCSLISRDVRDPAAELTAIILGISNVWPLILISYIIAAVAGMLVWVLEQRGNPEEFTPGNPFVGIGIGFWWAFVTMTTMGYGDLTPRSIPGRSIAMIWFLVGLVLNGILIGSIGSSLTIMGQPPKYDLYNTKTAAIYKSFEYNYAVKKNAKVDPDVRYLNVSSMLEALQQKTVDLVFIDTFSLASLQPTLKKKSLKVSVMLKTNSGYGLVLGGLSAALAADLQSEILVRDSVFSDFIASMKPKLPKLEKPKAGDNTGDIFSPDSYGIRQSVKWLFIVIGIISFFGITRQIYRSVRKRMKGTEQDNYMEKLAELQEMVTAFKSDFSAKIEGIEKKHQRELFRLATLKESYKKMVEAYGEETVELQLRISKGQADRRNVVQQMRYVDDASNSDNLLLSEEHNMTSSGRFSPEVDLGSSMYY